MNPYEYQRLKPFITVPEISEIEEALFSFQQHNFCARHLGHDKHAYNIMGNNNRHMPPRAIPRHDTERTHILGL